MYAEIFVMKQEGKWTIMLQNSLRDFPRPEREKYQTVLRMLENVVNSWEFRQELLALSLVETVGIRNTEVYKRIYNVGGCTPLHMFRFCILTHKNKSLFNGFNYVKAASEIFEGYLDHLYPKDRSFTPIAVTRLVESLVKHLMNGGELHDVNKTDKEIDIILGSTIPSKPFEPKLICTRSPKNLFRKECVYQ